MCCTVVVFWVCRHGSYSLPLFSCVPFSVVPFWLPLLFSMHSTGGLLFAHCPMLSVGFGPFLHAGILACCFYFAWWHMVACAALLLCFGWGAMIIPWLHVLSWVDVLALVFLCFVLAWLCVVCFVLCLHDVCHAVCLFLSCLGARHACWHVPSICITQCVCVCV